MWRYRRCHQLDQTEKTLAIYPIQVPVKPYRGADPKRRRKQSDLHRMANELTEFVNATVRASERDRVEVLYFDIARAAGYGYTEDQVRDLMYAIEAGSNAITVYKR
jgi:hypothetical protein